jgi:hypothetical protein
MQQTIWSGLSSEFVRTVRKQPGELLTLSTNAAPTYGYCPIATARAE